MKFGTRMLKILTIIAGLSMIGASLLHHRQQTLQIAHESAQLHKQLQDAQATLWRQQLDIASFVSPQAIRRGSTIPEPEPTIKAPTTEITH